jgi:citrate synthase
MDALRAAAAHLVAGPDASATRIEITAALAVFAAAWRRGRDGRAPVAPDPHAAHAADYLRMQEGSAAEPERVSALDRYLVTVADHGMNASTFTARVVASTDSDAVSAVVAAIGALKGPAHGGAPGPVLDMIEAIGTPERAHDWIADELEAGRRIMGVGHRVYRARDPRAAVLERAIESLEAAGIAAERLALARAIEKTAVDLLHARKPDRPLKANVEFYTAVLLSALGLPGDMFTPTFAVARVAGWLAHIMEQSASGRLIRPRARYVGPLPG